MRVHLTLPNIVSLFLNSAGNDFIFFPSPYVVKQRIPPLVKNFIFFANRNNSKNIMGPLGDIPVL